MGVQPMVNATHLHPSLEPTEVLKPSQDWEFLNGGGPFRGVNEGPWMVKVETTYYLMYSGADAHSEHYALGYATATSQPGLSPKPNRTPSLSWDHRFMDQDITLCGGMTSANTGAYTMSKKVIRLDGTA